MSDVASAVDEHLQSLTMTGEGKAPTRAFALLKAPASASTIKNLLRHYAKWVFKYSK